jgi:16S rRNA G1207 methylase RsmC
LSPCVHDGRRVVVAAAAMVIERAAGHLGRTGDPGGQPEVTA